MSEEQLCVLINFFLGKEMIRVQINYSDEISRSTVITHSVRQQQKFRVQDYTFGQMKHLRIMHYYYYELPIQYWNTVLKINTSPKNDSSRYSIGKKVANQLPNNSFFVTHMCHRPRVLFGLRDINYVYNVKVEEEEENVGAATAAAAAAVLTRNSLNSYFKFGICLL